MAWTLCSLPACLECRDTFRVHVPRYHPGCNMPSMDFQARFVQGIGERSWRKSICGPIARFTSCLPAYTTTIHMRDISSARTPWLTPSSIICPRQLSVLLRVECRREGFLRPDEWRVSTKVWCVTSDPDRPGPSPGYRQGSRSPLSLLPLDSTSTLVPRCYFFLAVSHFCVLASHSSSSVA